MVQRFKFNPFSFFFNEAKALLRPLANKGLLLKKIYCFFVRRHCVVAQKKLSPQQMFQITCPALLISIMHLVLLEVMSGLNNNMFGVQGTFYCEALKFKK